MIGQRNFLIFVSRFSIKNHSKGKNAKLKQMQITFDTRVKPLYRAIRRAVFNWVSWNQNQSNYPDQSQRTQSNPLSNQNSKQLHQARENLHEQVTIGFGFTSDW